MTYIVTQDTQILLRQLALWKDQ